MDMREQIYSDVTAALSGRTICRRCGATLATFGDLCRADLVDPCEGFLVIDAARKAARVRLNAPGSPA